MKVNLKLMIILAVIGAVLIAVSRLVNGTWSMFDFFSLEGAPLSHYIAYAGVISLTVGLCMPFIVMIYSWIASLAKKLK